MHTLPRPTLYPRTLSVALRHATFRPALLMATYRARPHTHRATVERPFRVMNQRRRLQAAYWAKEDTGSRGLIGTPRARYYGTERPMWVGGRP